MSPAGFLLLALGISIAGSLLLWARNHKPGGIDSSIDDFRRELAALSPERSPDAVVREQSRLRAEGRWIDAPAPAPPSGADAPSVVVHGEHDDRHEVLDAEWVHEGDVEIASEIEDGHEDGFDVHGGGDAVDVEAELLDDHQGGGYFDDLYRDDEER